MSCKSLCSALFILIAMLFACAYNEERTAGSSGHVRLKLFHHLFTAGPVLLKLLTD
jgi:hypothetical protein